jgi:3-dehydroquinate synthase
MNRQERALQGIEIGPLLELSFEKFLKTYFHKAKIAILVDENTYAYCLDFLITNFSQLSKAEVIQIPAGEASKDIEICVQLWQTLSEYQFGKKDLLINLGGGMITDLGGFVASVYKRGITFINVPTSLLAMVDAAVGGKNGIDFNGIKNQLGVIQFPEFTFVDPGFLYTLQESEVKNGFAEIIKHALIADEGLWAEIQLMGADLRFDSKLIRRAIEIKMTIVENDPFEAGERKLLNFGHTIGHGLEAALLHSGQIAHGHAVAIGMIGEAYISMRLGFLKQVYFKEIQKVILTIFKPLENTQSSVELILKCIYQDKKNELNKLNCTLLKGIGSASYDNFIEEHLLVETLTYLGTL